MIDPTGGHTGYAQVLEEHTSGGGGGGGLTRSYVLGDDVLSQSNHQPLTTTRHLLYDGHGSTRLLTDTAATPAITASYDFDAYGNALGSLATALTSLLYAGEYLASSANMYYLRARHYDAASGRFNRLDPFVGNNSDPQSLHKYAYAFSDPINLTDPSGNVPGLLAIIGFMILAAILTFMIGFGVTYWISGGNVPLSIGVGLAAIPLGIAGVGVGFGVFGWSVGALIAAFGFFLFAGFLKYVGQSARGAINAIGNVNRVRNYFMKWGQGSLPYTGTVVFTQGTNTLPKYMPPITPLQYSNYVPLSGDEILRYTYVPANMNNYSSIDQITIEEYVIDPNGKAILTNNITDTPGNLRIATSDFRIPTTNMYIYDLNYPEVIIP